MQAGPLCAFLASVTWAVGSSAYARLSLHHSPFAVNFSRALVALPCFLVAAFLTEGASAFSGIGAGTLGWLALSILGSYGLGDAAFLASTRTLGVPGALAIASSYPLWTATLGVLTRGEGLSLVQSVGLVASVAGLITVILSGGRGAARGPGSLWVGVGLAFATSLFWTLNTYAVSEAGRALPTPVANAVRMAMALAFCALFGAVAAPRRALILSAAEYRRFGLLLFIESVGGSYFFIYGLSHSPLAIGSTLSSLAPVLSVPVAVAFGVEKFSVSRTIGVFLTVAGLALLMGGGLR
jgi:drug/metabolite transporter (DMT)-like permease